MAKESTNLHSPSQKTMNSDSEHNLNRDVKSITKCILSAKKHLQQLENEVHCALFSCIALHVPINKYNKLASVTELRLLNTL